MQWCYSQIQDGLKNSGGVVKAYYADLIVSNRFFLFCRKIINKWQMITSRETHLSFVSPPLIFKGNRPRVFKVQTKQGHEVTSCTHKKKQRKHMKKELNNYWGTATNYSIASRTIINRHKLRAMKQFDSIHATKSIGFKLGKPYDQSQKTRDRSSLSLPNPTKN